MHASSKKKSAGRKAVQVICVGIFCTMMTALVIFYQFSKYDTNPISAYYRESPYSTGLRRRVVSGPEPEEQPQAFARGYIQKHLRGMYAKALDRDTGNITVGHPRNDYFKCSDRSSASAILNDDFCDCRYTLTVSMHSTYFQPYYILITAMDPTSL